MWDAIVTANTSLSFSPFSGGGVNSSSTIVLKKEDEFALPYSLLLPQASSFLQAKVGELIWDSLANKSLKSSLHHSAKMDC
ncbi:hypothetical protein Bca52824_053564 [Brassica carinata]|uniref:Uncharacterized protein n=1 Tax=Brassica carinata TaxID=52824 RepID=A0A8X7UL14_BRACI|nr:hypothetical protein Bca52824_053564 [Brassica carinata]